MTNQEAIEIINRENNPNDKEVWDTFPEYREALDMAIIALEQEPKTGHREYNDIYDHYLCGNCKTIVMDYDNFCPNCGARMVEPQESEDKE